MDRATPLPDARYNRHCRAVADAFSKSPGVDTTDGNRQKIRKVSFDPRAELRTALDAAFADQDESDDDEDAY